MSIKEITLYNTYKENKTGDIVRVLSIDKNDKMVYFIDITTIREFKMIMSTELDSFMERYESFTKPDDHSKNPFLKVPPFGFFITIKDECFGKMLSDIEKYTGYDIANKIMNVFDNGFNNIANVILYKTDRGWEINISIPERPMYDFYRIDYKDLNDFFIYLSLLESININDINKAIQQLTSNDNEPLFFFKGLLTTIMNSSYYIKFKEYEYEIKNKIEQCLLSIESLLSPDRTIEILIKNEDQPKDKKIWSVWSDEFDIGEINTYLLTYDEALKMCHKSFDEKEGSVYIIYVDDKHLVYPN